MKKIFNIQNLPLFLIEIYLIFSLLLYQFGPINWKTESPYLFWFLICLYHVSFIFGYLLVSLKKKKLRNEINIDGIIIDYFYVFLIICTLCSLIVYRNVTHSNQWISIDFFEQFINGLLNPGKQYYMNLRIDDFESSKIITVIFAFFSFIYTSMMPIGLFFWKKLKVGYKIWFLILVFFYFATYVSIGTNKGVFNTLFMIAGSMFLLYFTENYKSLSKFILENKTIFLISCFLIVFSIGYFGWTMLSRTGGATPNYQDTSINISNDTEKNNDTVINPPTVIVSEETDPDKYAEDIIEQQTQLNQNSGNYFDVLLYRITDYLTQGYYGMSLELDESFTTTYGIGNSDFLMSNFKSIFNIDVSNRTYQSKINDTWSSASKWHSFYGYWANDISFYGVIILMFILGAYTSMLWKDLMMNKNIIAFALLPLFIIMYFNMPGNNMIFTQMQTFCAFYELSFLYFLIKIVQYKKRGH